MAPTFVTILHVLSRSTFILPYLPPALYKVAMLHHSIHRSNMTVATGMTTSSSLTGVTLAGTQVPPP